MHIIDKTEKMNQENNKNEIYTYFKINLKKEVKWNGRSPFKTNVYRLSEDDKKENLVSDIEIVKIWE